MKKTILTIAMMIPAFTFAAEATAPAAAPKKEQPKMAAKMNTTELTLVGVTDANRTEIEKAAKEAGAKNASLDAKTGVLKISNKGFDKTKFEASVAKINGVSLKQ